MKLITTDTINFMVTLTQIYKMKLTRRERVFHMSSRVACSAVVNNAIDYLVAQ